MALCPHTSMHKNTTGTPTHLHSHGGLGAKHHLQARNVTLGAIADKDLIRGTQAVGVEVRSQSFTQGTLALLRAIPVCACVCMLLCACACMCMCVCMHAHACVRVRNLCMPAHLPAHTCKSIRACKCLCSNRRMFNMLGLVARQARVRRCSFSGPPCARSSRTRGLAHVHAASHEAASRLCRKDACATVHEPCAKKVWARKGRMLHICPPFLALFLLFSPHRLCHAEDGGVHCCPLPLPD